METLRPSVTKKKKSEIRRRHSQQQQLNARVCTQMNQESAWRPSKWFRCTGCQCKGGHEWSRVTRTRIDICRDRSHGDSALSKLFVLGTLHLRRGWWWWFRSIHASLGARAMGVFTVTMTMTMTMPMSMPIVKAYLVAIIVATS